MAKRKTASLELTPTQRELIRICEHSVQQLGLSRSLGQIFGVIYSSPVPLAFGDVAHVLDLSKGSISQGLRLLCEIEAIKLVRVPADRRDLYAPEPELRRLLMRMLHARLRTPLEQGAERLREFKARLYASDEPDRDFLFQRLSVLQTWHRKALRVLPLVQRTLVGSRA